MNQMELERDSFALVAPAAQVFLAADIKGVIAFRCGCAQANPDKPKACSGGCGWAFAAVEFERAEENGPSRLYVVGRRTGASVSSAAFSTKEEALASMTKDEREYLK